MKGTGKHLPQGGKYSKRYEFQKELQVAGCDE